MRLLFDQNLSFKLCRQLAELFPVSTQVRLVGLEKADDGAIWDFAATNGFMLVTLDADFAELAALRRPAAEGDLAASRQSADGCHRGDAAQSRRGHCRLRA